MAFVVIVALVVAGILPSPALGAMRRSSRTDGADGQLAGRLVALGLGAGLSVAGALAVAAEVCGGATGTALRRVVHASRRGGLAPVVPEADPSLRPLLAVLARAMATGSPVVAEVHAHLREADRDRRAAALVRAKAMPVRLTLPLTLLILPGCVLLLVGPAVLESFASLPGGGLLP